MNRRLGLLVVALSLALSASTVHARDGRLGLLVGGTLPSGDFSADITTPRGMGAGPGFTAGAFFDYMVNENVAVGVDAAFGSNSLKSEARDSLRSLSGDPAADVKYSSIGGNAHVKFFLPVQGGSFRPYVVGGAGVANFKGKLEGATPGDTSVTKFGGYGGLGANFKAGEKASAGLEVAYHILPVGDLFGIGQDVTATWVAIKAMVTFSLGSGGTAR